MEKALTPREARDAFDAFTKEVGPKASVYVSLSGHSGKALYCSVNPNGILGKEQFHVCADTFEELLAAVRAAWITHGDTFTANKIRALALKIIEITHDLGECTDAALRASFDPRDIERHGAQAVELANAMSEHRPFTIIATVGTNARAA